MHPLFDRADKLSREVIAAAIEVHKVLGEGLLESMYVKCLAQELMLSGHTVAEEVPCTLNYKGRLIDQRLRCDLLVDNCLIVEAKSIEPCDLQRFRMQLLSYMKILDKPLGLVINFGDSTLGGRSVRRVILKGADKFDESAAKCSFVAGGIPPRNAPKKRSSVSEGRLRSNGEAARKGPRDEQILPQPSRPLR